MKTVLFAIGGAVLGYIVVALTLGWFVRSDGLMVALYVAGMAVGLVLAVRTARRPAE